MRLLAKAAFAVETSWLCWRQRCRPWRSRGGCVRGGYRTEWSWSRLL